MNEFNSWTEINWYRLGSLLTQVAFLVAGVWFARNLLKTIRAFQEQVGALLKLSITATPSERFSATANTRRHSADAGLTWLSPLETQTADLSEPAESGPGRLVMAWRRLGRWLQAPMHTAEVSAWRRLIGWLQAPAGG
jgi:hypothetical protein